jgi:transposase
MIEKRRKFTADFKREAVRLTEETDKSVAEIARELGINPNTLYRWRQEQAEYAEQAFPGNGRLRPEEEELRGLRRELEIVKQERDILKKAISIFSARQR